MVVYSVHAYRWGDRDNHSYSVGVYETEAEAINAANAESEYRGGKYECEVLAWQLGYNGSSDAPGMPYKVIKAIPPIYGK